MSKCAWLICEREALDGKAYCLRHNSRYGAVSVITNTTKPLAKKSAKRKVEDKLLSKMFKARMAINNRCELKIKGVCTGKAQGFDHTQKTSPANRLDPANLKLACNACNLVKELHPLEAIEAGISKSKFK